MARQSPRSLAVVFAAVLVMGAAGTGRADAPSVRLDLADGGRVSDMVMVVARPSSPADAEVQQVVFAIDGAARFTDTSTPYAYEWDTLESGEGEHTVVATVTDSKGRTATTRVRVTVDNEIARGAEYHASAALTALRANDAAIARARVRRALKIEPGNLTAARVRAALLDRDGEVDAAIAALSAATIPDGDFEARAQLADLHMRAASPDIDLPGYLRHAEIAADLRHKAAEAKVAALAGKGAETAVERGDVRLLDRQWEAAVAEYVQAADLEHASGPLANRIALAYVLAGRDRDAMTWMRRVTRENRADDATAAIEGMRLLRLFRFEDARKAVKELVDAERLPGLIIQGYADIALKDAVRGRDAVRRAIEIAPNNPDVLLLQAHLATDSRDPRDALVRAAQANRRMPEPFVTYAFLEMTRTDPKRFQRAEGLLQLALKIAPAHRPALIGMALCRMGQDDPAGAGAAIDKVRATTKAADVETIYALVARKRNDETETRRALENAAQMAPDQWGGLSIEPLPDLIAHVFRYRLSPILTPATLYLSKEAR